MQADPIRPFNIISMTRGRSLTRDESTAINSILDDEESRFSGGLQLRPRLSELDEQCRQIWPNWEPTMTMQPSARPSRPETPEMRPARRLPRADPPPTLTPLLSDRRPTERPPDRSANDIDSVKSEVNALMARIRGHTSPPVAHRSSPAERLSPPVFPSIPERPRKLFDPPEVAPLFDTREPRAFESPRFRQFEQPDPLVDMPSRTGPPDFLMLQQENVRLKAELLKTRKKLQAAEEEIKKLLIAIEKSEILRKRANEQLAAVRQSG
jgi:hypothetical protein